MNSKKQVKIGIVGLGGRSMAWIPNSLINPACRITALCDKIDTLVQQKLALVAKQEPQVKIKGYTDVDTMLKEADIDAVVVVAAPEHHADLICRALEAGKHVIAEVPLCFSIEDCWRVVRAVEKTGLKFQLGEQCQFSPYVQAWKRMIKDGTLGKILYVEGQYLHGPGPDRFWHDSKTGARITWEQAQKVTSHKSRTWNLIHPIRYMSHEIVPLLNILDDRVVKVTGLATRPQSYRYDWFSRSDIEVALMHTEKDTIMRLMAGFTLETCVGSEHCCRMIGVKGWVEQARTKGERDKLWFDNFMANQAEVDWNWNAAWDAPRECAELEIPYSPQAHASGHGGLDYYPIATFCQSILKDKPTVLDVYKAAEAAAPTILAGECLEKGYTWMDVPDFRPGKRRKEKQKSGESPRKVSHRDMAAQK